MRVRPRGRPDLSGRFMTVYVCGREGPLLCVTVGRPEGSSRPPRLPAVRASSRRRTRWPAARRSRASAVGTTSTRDARWMALAARDFWLCCKYEVVWTSNEARARSGRACRAAPPHPDVGVSMKPRGRLTTRHRGASRAAQRILSQRGLILGCRQHCVRLCHPGATAPESWLHRGVHRRHSSSPRPKGQP